MVYQVSIFAIIQTSMQWGVINNWFLNSHLSLVRSQCTVHALIGVIAIPLDTE